VTDSTSRPLRSELLTRIRHAVRGALRNLDRRRALYANATYLREGQAAIRLLIVAAVLVVVLLFSIALVWFS
jgi:hypothetical protein